MHSLQDDARFVCNGRTSCSTTTTQRNKTATSSVPYTQRDGGGKLGLRSHTEGDQSLASCQSSRRS